MALSEKTIEIVKKTADELVQNSKVITLNMCDILVDLYPPLKPVFGLNTPDKNAQFTTIVRTCIADIDDVDALRARMNKMLTTSNKIKVPPEKYPMVGVCFLTAVKQALGERATDEVVEAWKDTYFFLVDILITAEK